MHKGNSVKYTEGGFLNGDCVPDALGAPLLAHRRMNAAAPLKAGGRILSDQHGSVVGPKYRVMAQSPLALKSRNRGLLQAFEHGLRVRAQWLRRGDWCGWWYLHGNFHD